MLYLKGKLSSNIKKCIIVLCLGATLVNPMYAMSSFYCSNNHYKIVSNYSARFLNFKGNSIFSMFTKDDITTHKKRCNTKEIIFKENSIDFNTLKISYNLMKYYVDGEHALNNVTYIQKNIITELISYISNYAYDGTFWSVCEIFHLTLECLIRTNKERMVGINDMHFNFEKFKENDDIITFKKFKECMVARLKNLLESM